MSSEILGFQQFMGPEIAEMLQSNFWAQKFQSCSRGPISFSVYFLSCNLVLKVKRFSPQFFTNNLYSTKCPMLRRRKRPPAQITSLVVNKEHGQYSAWARLCFICRGFLSRRNHISCNLQQFTSITMYPQQGRLLAI